MEPTSEQTVDPISLLEEAALAVAKTPKQAKYLARMADLHEVLSAHQGGIERLWEEAQRRREHHSRQRVDRLLTGDKAVDQREIDYWRGFWQGVVVALVALPREASNAYEKVQKGIETEDGDS